MEQPKEFKLERYFAKYEFNTKYLLCCSDVETMSMEEIIAFADEESKALWRNLKLGYTESKGHPLLIKEVAAFHNMDPEDVIIFAPQEGIYIAMQCLFSYLSGAEKKKFHAIVIDPAYQSLQENLRTYNCDISYWTVNHSKDGWSFGLEDFKSLLKDDTKLLVVNFPHNPTGFIPSKEMWQEIVKICNERHIFLFSDEMYRLSNNDGTPPLQSACTLLENSVTLCGMSKTLALPGLRIGWLCTKNRELMNMMANMKDYVSICSSAPSEILAIIALRQSQMLVERTLSIIRKNLDLLDEFFSKYPNLFNWKRPTACTHSLLELKSWLLQFPDGGATGFCNKLVNDAEVLLAPASMFDYEDRFVRLGFARVNLADGLKAIEEFIKKNDPST